MASSEAQIQRDFARDVVVRLREAGFQALWAGGCVRDLILGLEPSDYDVATDATPEQVMTTLPFRAIPVGLSFGVVRVRHPREYAEVEVATFRSDNAYLDGRRPTSVVFSTPEEDAKRRDFTVNGLFMDPMSGDLIDYVGGQADLAHRVLRAIGDPIQRFGEDKLRLLRAVRFAARFEMKIDPTTWSAIPSMAREIAVVSPERICQELRKILAHPTRSRAMEMCMDTGLLATIMPPVADMKGLFQGKPMQPEGDLWDHTVLVLSLLPDDASFALTFAALVHDVGKPRTRSRHQGRACFHNHEQVGSRIADTICRMLRFSNAEREEVGWLVAYHQYLGEAKKLREAKLKKMLAHPGIRDLLALHRADALASTGDAEQIDYCEYYLENQPTGPINPPPLLTGHDLARHGLEPGIEYKLILDRVREAQLERRVHSKREAIEWVDRYLSTRAWPADES